MGHFRDSKRIVIKVGTSTLTHSTGHLNLRRIEKLVKVLSDMKNWGVQAVQDYIGEQAIIPEI